jgi:hypothetical protein
MKKEVEPGLGLIRMVAEKVGKFSSSMPQAENIWQSTDPDVNNLRVGSGFDNMWRAVFRIRIRMKFVSWIRIQLLIKLAPKAKIIHII